LGAQHFSGKIGRLPHDIRQQLNDCEVVRERLAEYFDSRSITEQNLSDWKQGGFLSQAEELGEEVGESTLAERTTEVVALALLQLFESALKAESEPEQRQAVLEMARELARLRRAEHQRQRWEVEEEEELREAEAERGFLCHECGGPGGSGIEPLPRKPK